MTKTLISPVLAVDGGGTRCRIALALGAEIVQVETGSANVSSNFDLAVSEILKALGALQNRSGVPMTQLIEVPAYLGLAGMVSPPIAARLREALPLHHMQIEDDRPAALRGALGAYDGAIAHCGTGSFLGSQIGQTRRLIGGWGPRLGDEASGQWLGRLALSHTLDVIDGLTPGSALSIAVLDHFDGGAEIVDFVGAASPAEIGGFAKTVTLAAQDDDAAAQNLLQQGANYIADRLQRLGWKNTHRLCLTGGVADHYAPYLPAPMQTALAQPLGDPMSGALSLAAQFSAQLSVKTNQN